MTKDVEEVYTVKIKRDPETQIAWSEEWLNEKGQTHRVNGPAMIERNAITGEPLTEYWFSNNHGPLLPGTSQYADVKFGSGGKQSFPPLRTEPQPPLGKHLAPTKKSELVPGG